MELGTDGKPVPQTLQQLLENIGIKIKPENVLIWQSFIERALAAFSSMA